MVRVRFSRVWRVVLRMGYPLVRWSLQMMTQDGGKTAQFQGDHERCRGSTTKFGGMWNCPLPTPEERLLFMLVYLKTYALQVVQGRLFSMGQRKTNQWMHVLLPALL